MLVSDVDGILIEDINFRYVLICTVTAHSVKWMNPVLVRNMKSVAKNADAIVKPRLSSGAKWYGNTASKIHFNLQPLRRGRLPEAGKVDKTK